MNDFLKNWEYSEPTFDYQQDWDDSQWPWTGHTYWGYDLVKNLKPDVIVELGTHKGTSIYSFAQALKDGKINSEIFAVDTWQGDEQAGFYGNEIYDFVVTTLRKYYIQQNVRLLKMTFDEASKKFENKSIDLLHIDGLHTYDAVKKDYDTWKGKVKDNGIIMFHDIKVPDFGVWEVWNDVKRENPDAVALEFNHNFGLGVLIKDKKAGETLTPELKNCLINYYNQKAINHNFAIEKQRFLTEINNLQGENNNLKNIIQTFDNEREKFSNQLENHYKEKLHHEEQINHLKESIKNITTRRGFKFYNRILKIIKKDLKI